MCSLQAKLRVQNDDSSVSSSFDEKWINGSPRGEDGESARSYEGSGNFDTAMANVLRPSSSSKADGGGRNWSPAEEYSVDPKDKKRESVRSSSQQSSRAEVQYHIASVEGDTADESYYIIDANPQFPMGVDIPGNRFLDVNALASKLASLEVAHGQMDTGGPSSNSSLGPPGDVARGENQSENLTGFTEISLEGGAAHTVTVKVEKKGTAMAWEFLSEPKGLAFGLFFQEDVPDAKVEQVRSPLSLSRWSVSCIAMVTDPPTPSLCLPQGHTDWGIRGPENWQLHLTIRQLSF